MFWGTNGKFVLERTCVSGLNRIFFFKYGDFSVYGTRNGINEYLWHLFVTNINFECNIQHSQFMNRGRMYYYKNYIKTSSFIDNPFVK